MGQLKRYNGTNWENVGGNIAPKTVQTTSDTDTYSCNYINEQLNNKQDTIEDTGWVTITFDSNSNFSARSGAVYAPKYRKIGNVVYLQGQFQVTSALTALTIYNVTGTNLPRPQYQHSFSISGYSDNYGTAWVSDTTITFKPYTNWSVDNIGIAIDGCYITDN